MEDRIQLRKLNKKDVVLLLLLVGAAAALLAWFWFGHQEKGAMVEVTVDGELYGTYPLNENREIPITSQTSRNGKEAVNYLVISDGSADMVRADCPDKLCVRQAAISHVGETIICLPNRVVVTITGEEAALTDTTIH